MCSPENNLERVPSTSGPFASSSLCPLYPRRCSHRGPHHIGNISMAGNPERRALLCHTGSFLLWASFTSPAHGRLSSILPGPPLPICTNFLCNAVFPSSHICILCTITDKEMDNIREHHTPNLWVPSHQCLSFPPSRSAMEVVTPSLSPTSRSL